MVNLHETLLNHVVNIRFTKADGTERAMKCTLKKELLETAGLLEDYTESKYDASKDIEHVVDVELGEWRSFKPSRLIEWNIYA